MRTQIRYTVCLILGLLGFKAMPAQALEMFLCIDGIDGEVTPEESKAHNNCIDVLAWSWGTSSSGMNVPGGSPDTGARPNVQDISVTKWLDRSSPLLGRQLTLGKTVGPMTLYVESSCGTGCGDPVYRLEIPSGSFVTSQSQGGSGGESRLTETVTFNIPAVEWCYNYDPDGAGGAAGTDVCDGWSILLNQPYP